MLHRGQLRAGVGRSCLYTTVGEGVFLLLLLLPRATASTSTTVHRGRGLNECPRHSVKCVCTAEDISLILSVQKWRM